MADMPSPAILAEFKRLYDEAQEVAYNHDEFLLLIYRAALDVDSRRPASSREEAAARAFMAEGGYDPDWPAWNGEHAAQHGPEKAWERHARTTIRRILAAADAASGHSPNTKS